MWLLLYRAYDLIELLAIVGGDPAFSERICPL